MQTKIDKYVDMVFRDVPKSERAETIIGEIKQNLNCKYNELIEEGRSEEDAYAIAVSSGGDLSCIVADLSGEKVTYTYAVESQFDRHYEKERRREKKKIARWGSTFWPLVTAGYLLYSFLVPGAWSYSWLIFLLAASFSSFYAAALTKSDPKIRKNKISGGVWTGVVVLYFAFSFITGRWGISWLIFVVAGALSVVVHAIRHPDDDDDDEE